MLSGRAAHTTLSGHCRSKAQVVTPRRLLSRHPVSPQMCKITGEIKKKDTLAGESCLTSVSPPPSSAASYPAGPLSGHARPRHLSGPTGPASGPSFLAPPCYRSKVGGLGGARALLLWGPRLGQPWAGRQQGWRN